MTIDEVCNSRDACPEGEGAEVRLYELPFGVDIPLCRTCWERDEAASSAGWSVYGDDDPDRGPQRWEDAATCG